MRIGIVGLSHESNTFLSTPTDRPQFEVHIGGDVQERWEGTQHEVGGFLDGIERAGLEAVPVFWASATPSGKITAKVLDGLVAEMLQELGHRGPFDGVLAAAHGAAVAEGHGDADGYWLGLLREAIGADTPIVVTTDAHANLTPAMLKASDALITYRTNPHLDTHARGLEAASLMSRIVAGEATPIQRGSFPPMAINILLQATAESPCLPLYELAEEMRTRPGVLSVSIALGFPYADVPEVGTSFVVVTDADAPLATACADELAAALLARRRDFIPDLISPAAAVEMAASTPGPVCLLDMGDNIGGGSAGDGTTLAHVIAERGGPRTFIALYDPESAARARELGVGAAAEFSVGGKTDGLHGSPLTIDARVRSLHSGRFTEPDVRHGGGDRFDMGPTAILDSDRGLTIQVTSIRIPPFSLGQITSCDLDPAEFDILVAKGVHSPVPAYSPVCPTLIRVDTPGSTAADMAALPFRHRRVPLYPLEELSLVHDG
ncbi:MAG: M81 family metallopeptidase [Chloroflexota bacterium]